ncbi:MAG: PIN domain-containing protein [Myxococcales bacterium]|nr:PIN domain-containing protein [Myxococcales bacterium]
MRVVLDTDVALGAMRSPTGASAAVVRGAMAGRVTLLATTALLLEYEAVLTRPEQHAAAGLSLEGARAFVDQLAKLTVPVTPWYSWRPLVRDPNDELVLEAAINGAADLVVTHNVRDYGLASGRFGLGVSRPGPALLRIRFG